LNPVWWQGIGLGVAFSFVTASGALFAWRVGYVDVGSGSGLLLIGIFVVLVARAAQSRIKLGLNGLLLFVALLGYLGVFQMAITLGMRPQWLRGLTAITLLIFLLMLPRKKGKLIAI
jgi:putative ABC transport system permease protein